MACSDINNTIKSFLHCNPNIPEEKTLEYQANDNNIDLTRNDCDFVPATVFMISGCEDKQTSSDVSNISSFQLPDPSGRSGGACTSALLGVLYATKKSSTFVEVLYRMRSSLRKRGFSQIPQLTSSQPIDVNDPFYIVPPDCQGTKRAVLIGINYVGQNGELSGCHNDVSNMKQYLIDECDIKEKNITVLMDDGVNIDPTRNNILYAYTNAVKNSTSGDAVFCHYSGHGGRIRDDDKDEEKDGYDETLVPVDFASAGQIRDDDIYTTLVSAMPAGVTLVSLMDCCHSGTVLDLPYVYRADQGSSQMVPNDNTYLGKENRVMTCVKLMCAVVVLCIILLIVSIIFLFRGRS